MSTNKTQNLNLHSWAPGDPFKRAEFNENWAAIDADSGAAWTAIEARGAEIAAETAARGAAIAAETSARQGADAALQSAVAAETAARVAGDHLVKLYERTLTAAETTRVDIDVSGFGLADYVLLFLLVEAKITTVARGFWLLLDDATSGYSVHNSGSGTYMSGSALASGSGDMLLALHGSRFGPITYCAGYNLASMSRSCLAYCQTQLTGVATLNVVSSSGSGPLLAGSRVVLWGLKY